MGLHGLDYPDYDQMRSVCFFVFVNMIKSRFYFGYDFAAHRKKLGSWFLTSATGQPGQGK